MQAVTLGPEGTYSHRAASAVADEVEFRESVTAIVEAVADGGEREQGERDSRQTRSDGDFERGVVPIENSIEGSVTETLDALTDREVAAVREIVTPIRHALLAQRDDFSVVASHSQALAQCRSYLEADYPDAELEAVASTARGVEYARENPDVAAIGHPDNASGGDDLRVVAEGIQDRNSNATRFFVIAPASERSEAGGKSSLVVYPNANYPGLLLELLEPFAERDINLTRVESRPSGERLGDYVFHVDFEAGLYEKRAQEAIADVEAIAEKGWVHRLGSYDAEHVVY
jgi:prephenate dehydratase